MIDPDEVEHVARRRVAAVLERAGLVGDEVECPIAVALAVPVGDEICMASCLRGTGNRCILTVGVAQGLRADEITLLRLVNAHNVSDLVARALVRPSLDGFEVLAQETVPITLIEDNPAYLGWLVRTMVGSTAPELRQRLAVAGLVAAPYVWGAGDDIERLTWMSVS